MVHNRIRELRKSKGWSLDELCRRSEVSRSYLWTLETEGGSPGIDVCRKIASALGDSVDNVFPVEVTANSA